MPLIPTRRVQDEPHQSGLDLWDIQEVLTAGHEYRRREAGVCERFLLVHGRVRKVVVHLREDHILLVDLKHWRPSPRRLRALRRKAATDAPRDQGDNVHGG